jgi:hypothetical protein
LELARFTCAERVAAALPLLRGFFLPEQESVQCPVCDIVSAVLDDIIAAVAGFNIPVEVVHAEACNGQFELVTEHKDGITVCSVHLVSAASRASSSCLSVCLSVCWGALLPALLLRPVNPHLTGRQSCHKSFYAVLPPFPFSHCPAWHLCFARDVHLPH